ADSTGLFSFFDVFVSLNDSGKVAFGGTLDTSERGIFVGDGTTINTIVDDTGPFASFGPASINNSGVVAFKGFLDAAPDHGIFTGPNPLTDKVIQTGDTLDGRTVRLLDFSPFGLNDNGSLVFFAQFDDGFAIYRADPLDVTVIPEPTTLTLLLCGFVGVAVAVRKGRQRNKA
ncbi:MAG: hypothetical protein NZT92_18740, partial [Abditibacteriales bacterium]|nr:hypothetical protein [Abditibacteriales bacterium]